MRFIVSVCALLFALWSPSAALAGVEARVSVSAQRMSVYVDGVHAYDWSVSTGRSGFETPHGSYSAKSLVRMHYSRKYHNSPMPYSVFFAGGYAVHGTSETRRLGMPASHGCVRLHPSNAAQLYSLVAAHGLRKSRIVISY